MIKKKKEKNDLVDIHATKSDFNTLFNTAIYLYEQEIPELEKEIDEYMKQLGDLPIGLIKGSNMLISLYSHNVSAFIGKYGDIIEEVSSIDFASYSLKSQILNEKMPKIPFVEQYKVYKSTHNLIHYDKAPEFNKLGVDLFKLRELLQNSYSELKHFLDLEFYLKSSRNKYQEIIHSFISFGALTRGRHHECCHAECKHTFIRLLDELKCVYCGATTKGLDLSDKEFEFLIECAKAQNLLIEHNSNATYYDHDLPFIRTIVDKQDYYLKMNELSKKTLEKLYDSTFVDDEDTMEELEEHEIFVVRLPDKLKKAVQKAHELDEGDGIIVDKERYFGNVNFDEMLKNIEEDLFRLKSINMNTANKELIEEMCKIAKYEILILSGKYVPKVFWDAPEEDKIAAAKAYYNLSNEWYRINSGYFMEDGSRYKLSMGIDYKCLTADPSVNAIIVRNKVKRFSKGNGED